MKFLSLFIFTFTRLPPSLCAPADLHNHNDSSRDGKNFLSNTFNSGDIDVSGHVEATGDVSIGSSIGIRVGEASSHRTGVEDQGEHSDIPCVGCPQDSPIDEEVIAAAQYATAHLPEVDDFGCAKMKLVKVVNAKTQVVAGTNFFLTLILDNCGTEMICENIVVFRPLPFNCQSTDGCLELTRTTDISCKPVNPGESSSHLKGDEDDGKPSGQALPGSAWHPLLGETLATTTPYGNSFAKLAANVNLKYFNKKNLHLGTSWDKGGEKISFDASLQLNIQNAQNFDLDMKTTFVSHGYTNTASQPQYCEDWVENYKASGQDVQVVCIDWRHLAWLGVKHDLLYCGGEYNCEAKNSVDVGWWLGHLLHSLVEKTGLKIDKVHLAGHSLGAHVVGMMGRTFTSLSGKQVARVTGMDPAGPLFTRNKYGLHKYEIGRDSGAFVDIIHTSGSFDPYVLNVFHVEDSCHYGDLHALGHADFYPNGGMQQTASGCEAGCDGVSCSHHRAVFYYLDSILGDSTSYPAYPCASPQTCSEEKKTSNNVANYMGEYAKKPIGVPQKQYYLSVDSVRTHFTDSSRDGKSWFSTSGISGSAPYGNSFETLSSKVHLKYFNKNNLNLGTSWDKGGESISFTGSQVNIEDEGNFISDIKTVFISHGYDSSASEPGLCADWVENYKKSGQDVQVVCIDWRNLAWMGFWHDLIHCGGEYNCEAKNSVDVGWWLGHLLHGLVEKTGLNVEKVHLAGHSLGAHAVGMMGRIFTSLSFSGQQVARVTGLDPAGPLFVQNNYGLHKYEIGRDSGDFVDIIHTCGDFDPHAISIIHPTTSAHFGDLHALGDADFYPNGGMNQAASGCEPTFGVCSHGRSYVYYLQSILDGPSSFPSYPCASAETCSEGEETSDVAANHLGEYATKPVFQQQYYLKITTDYGSQ